MSRKRHLFLATFFVLGSSFLLARTFILIAAGALVRFTWWAAILLIVESLLNIIWLGASLRYGLSKSTYQLRPVLRAATAAIIFHALRVGIFVIGRTGPWKNFDVRPEYWATHVETWTWTGVYLAGTLSALSVVAVIVIWYFRKRTTSSTS